VNPAASAQRRPRGVPLPALRVGADTAAVAALTAAAAALRFSTLAVQSLWKDEAVTVVRILKPSLGATLSTIPHSEATPPLYYVLAWAWTRLFGTSEAGIRSLSALIGTAIVPVAYLAARRVAPRRYVPVAAAALVAFSPYLIWYSQEARAYALLALLCAWSFLLFLRARQTGDRTSFLWWGAVSALALATHYFAIFIVGAEAAWLVWERRRAVLPALVIPVAAGAALLPLALHQERNGHDGWIHRLSLSGRAGNTVKLFLTSPSSAPALLILLAGTLVVAALVMLVTVLRDEAGAVVVPAAMVVAVVGVPLVLSLLGEDFFFHRNVIAAWVPAAIVVGAVASRRAGVALTAALCAVFLATVVAVDTNARYQRADWRSVARALGPAAGPRAVVTPSLGDEPLEYYLRGRTAMLHGSRRVAEVDVVGWPSADAPLPAAPRGMRRLAIRKVGAFTFIRYRAAAPLTVTARGLAALHLGSDHPGVLFEPGRH
jgi:mannosyltransferase